MLQTLSCYAFSLAIILAFYEWTPSFIRIATLKVTIFGFAVYVWYFLARISDQLIPRRKVSPLNKAVFITGCDTGFGHELAKRLDLKGFKVFAGCLVPEGPNAKRLKEATSSNLSIIGADVTSDESVQKAFTRVSKELNNAELLAVVNNAGIAVIGELEWIQIEDYKTVFDVNTFGLARVTKAFLPLLRKSKGRVVTTTSHSGRFTVPRYVPYCMSKYAATSFCEGLRLEMEKWNVSVTTVEPLMFRTPLTRNNLVIEGLTRSWDRTPEKVKEVYGLQYLEKYKDDSLKFFGYASSNIYKVVDSLEEAATAVSPHYLYTPGDTQLLILDWFIRRLPLRIRNKMLKFFVYYN